MPYIVIIIDEFGDLIMTAGKEVELPICRIAQLARAVAYMPLSRPSVRQRTLLPVLSKLTSRHVLPSV